MTNDDRSEILLELADALVKIGVCCRTCERSYDARSCDSGLCCSFFQDGFGCTAVEVRPTDVCTYWSPREERA